MVKTSTSLKTENHSSQKHSEMPADLMEEQNELFYKSIKSELDKLVKTPSDEVIAKILAYASRK